MQQTPRRSLALRWGVVALSVFAAALFVASFFMPWWRLWLFAPQYPKGLEVAISLTGVTGDVRELNILNHYIGMKGLEHAAPFERSFAAQGVGLIAVLALVFTLVAGKRWSWLLVVVGAAFPITFMIDGQYWMWKFGHSLDPHAPLRIPTFTPQLFGTGQIGQFMTFARPDPGFWLAVAAVALLLIAAVLRYRVCSKCARADDCGAVCPNGFIGPHAGEAKKG
ncbi:MAG: cytochrome C [Deltaproteobacteria bacterium]|nr:cytochrome C [Deltaproteobacteria bacterium]